MYLILAITGWVWLGVTTVLFLVRKARLRARSVGFEVVERNEKQS